MAASICMAGGLHFGGLRAFVWHLYRFPDRAVPQADDGCAWRPARLVCRSVGRMRMDLGIRGRKAIVCASSRGLGRGCAAALAEAGCDLVLNGRDRAVLAATAQEIRAAYGVDVVEV